MDKLTKYTNTSVIIKTNELVDEANKLKNKTEELEIKKANLKSPALTGTPTAPTPSEKINNSQIATTAFVNTKTKSLVKGPDTSLNNHIATFNGTGGKEIKDSGLTIGKSVPSNAVFTDTHHVAHQVINNNATSTYNSTSINGNTRINLVENGIVRDSHLIKGTGATEVSSDDAGNITIKSTNTTYADMTGATASAAGKAGLVPAPAAGTQAKYLRGDGTWQTPPYIPLAGGTLSDGSAAISKKEFSTNWYTGRDTAPFKIVKDPIFDSTTTKRYCPIFSVKSVNGSWELGPYTSDILHLSYITDANYNSQTNKQTADFQFKTTGEIVVNKVTFKDGSQFWIA